MAFLVLGIVGATGLILAGVVLLMLTCLKKAAPDEALVVTRPSRERLVSFTTAMAYPVVHQISRVSLREHVLVVERQDGHTLRTRDDHQLELIATFRLRVNRTAEDVLRAATAMGPATGDLDAVRARFLSTLVDALESAARELDAAAIDHDRSQLKDRVLAMVGTDLDGFRVEDLAITGVRVLAGSAYRG